MDNTAIENLCRLCDKKSAIMLSVFQKNSEGLQILNVIKDCLPLVIYRTDPLSKAICIDCHNNLEILYNFKKGVLDVNNRHRKQLKENVSNFKVQLYLDIVENNGSGEKLQNGDRSVKLIMKDTSTLTDPFQESRIDDDSDMNSLNSILMRTNGHNNNDIDSDMEICEDIAGESEKIMLKCRNMEPYTLPIVKKKRVIGPKCQMSPNPRVKVTKLTRYDPLSLMKCVVHSLNKYNVPDFEEDPYEVLDMELEEIIPLCIYCETVFESENELALHEVQEHIKLTLEKVDVDGYWSGPDDDAFIRNKWFEKSQVDSDEASLLDEDMDGDIEADEDCEDECEEDYDDGEDLLVPMEENDGNDLRKVQNTNVIFINEQPTLNGISLKDIPKDERSEFYQSVRLNGVNRKFCNLCRYTFKDNWAIELHYMSRTCYYSCNYCGSKFNKMKFSFAKHIADHKAAGHQKSNKVFVNKTKSGTVPKLLSPSCLRPYFPMKKHGNRYTTKVKPIKMKSLLEKKRVNPSTLQIKSELVQVKTEPGLVPMTTADLQKSDNKAYFCKKCYQVFCRLNEYNEHNQVCTGEIKVPEMQVIRPYLKREKEPLIKTPVKTKIENDVEVYSSTGRPVRHCVKEIASYCDDVDVKGNKSEVTTRQSSAEFECHLCSSVFPTLHSRNSHMRIHKVGVKRSYGNASQIAPSRQNSIRSPEPIIPVKRIKREQETFEPIVEIHEGPSSKVPSNIGSVSITPINQRNKVSAEIMELVQNNPNITIKTTKSESTSSSYNRSQQHHSQYSPRFRSSTPMSSNNTTPETPSSERTYKCSSCSLPFANKSNLYFHKKNQCGGSRYPCPFCKKRFGTEATYSAHIFYSHPV